MKMNKLDFAILPERVLIIRKSISLHGDAGENENELMAIYGWNKYYVLITLMLHQCQYPEKFTWKAYITIVIFYDFTIVIKSTYNYYYNNINNNNVCAIYVVYVSMLRCF